MKNTLYKTSIAAGAAVLISGLALTAFAQTGIGVGVNASASAAVGTTGVTVSAKVQAAITTGVNRADTEITRRINALNALSTRVNAMVKLSSGEKASLASTIQTQISAMNTLQAQISTDAAANSTTSLKADIQSITKSYRIFALIIPQGAVEAASDRVLDVSGMLGTISTKLQTRISALPSGTDTTSLNASLSDMNTQIANANASTNTAVSETANLQPDNGDATIMASNTAALKDAHTKIVAAQQDVLTARKDAGVIVKALVAMSPSASAGASATVTASGTAQ